MNAQEFINFHNGRGVDVDGYAGNQCMDLYLAYEREVLGIPLWGAACAKLVWNSYPPQLEKIPNTPSGVPRLGDVVVWTNGTYGHIAIATGVGDTNTFQTLDQNYPYGLDNNPYPAKLITHNYNGVAGWLRPKGDDMTPEQHQAILKDIGQLYKDSGNQQAWLTNLDKFNSQRFNETERDRKKNEEQDKRLDALEKHTHPAPEEKPVFDEPTKSMLQSISDFMRKILNR